MNRFLILIFFSFYSCFLFGQVRCFDTIQQNRILNSLKNEKILMQIVLEQDTVISLLENVVISKDNIIMGMESKYKSERIHNDYLNSLVFQLTKTNNDLRKENNKLEKKARQRKYWFAGGVIIGALSVIIL